LIGDKLTVERNVNRLHKVLGSKHCCMDSKGQWPAPGVGHTHGWEMFIVVCKLSWSVEWLLCRAVRSCGVAGVSQRRMCLFGFSPGFVLVEPVLLFHKFLEEWAASVFGTTFPDLAQGTCRNEFGFESDSALPRTVLTRTVATH
jgi:hypothetical protein